MPAATAHIQDHHLDRGHEHVLYLSIAEARVVTAVEACRGDAMGIERVGALDHLRGADILLEALVAIDMTVGTVIEAIPEVPHRREEARRYVYSSSLTFQV